ncbi:MAG: FtsQ-type POTRA domain-containing protein [Tissierellia bacterium]|nr:FtsQ-type POTRA domain-containing protein [Tissierellia bacterium]
MKNSRRYQKRKKREKRRKRILNLLLLLFIIALIYLFVFKTDFFNIKNIEIKGNKNLSDDQILKASICMNGENIFKINNKYCEENINKLAYVKSVKIIRKLPSTIKIQIVEREEIAIIPYIGAFVYIDEEGYVLRMEERKGDTELPQVFGLELINLQIGDCIFDSVEGSGNLDFFTLGKEAKLLEQMKYINFSDKKNTMIELNNGIKVAFGPLDNVKYKLSFLSKILKDIEEKKLVVKQILMNKGENPIIVMDDI